ncbi:hypothetical protein GCM10022226_31830 [Sphaerisporangium flaviroseum]|uniref:Uncharacterized protein n=1 Tax=Sphaerisporangium flaviroseum TaxID=509199 RepID=A0ABP7I3Q8_9ACTN
MNTAARLMASTAATSEWSRGAAAASADAGRTPASDARTEVAESWANLRRLKGIFIGGSASIELGVYPRRPNGTLSTNSTHLVRVRLRERSAAAGPWPWRPAKGALVAL